MPRYSEAYLAAHAGLPNLVLAPIVRVVVAAYASARRYDRLTHKMREVFEAIPVEARAYWEVQVPERNRAAARRRYAEKRAASRERVAR